MAIITATDFNSTMTELTRDTSAMTAEFSKRMSSAEYNAVFSAIEAEMNAIYNNLRLLEDVKNYTREFLIKEIQNRKQKFLKQLKVIEDNSDQLQDTSYIVYEMPMDTKETVVRDRNGDEIKTMIYADGRLESVDKMPSVAAINSVKRSSDHACHNSTAQNLTEGEPSRSFYRAPEPPYDGISEDYEVEFRCPVKCNYIKLNSVNCEPEDVVAVLSDGTLKPLDTYKGFINECDISGLKFTLHCKDFRISSIGKGESGAESFSEIADAPYKRRNSEDLIHDMNESAARNVVRRYKNNFMTKNRQYEEIAEEADQKNWKISKEV